MRVRRQFSKAITADMFGMNDEIAVESEWHESEQRETIH